MNIIEIKSGTKYGKWTVLYEASPRLWANKVGLIKKIRLVACRCDCGREDFVALGQLRQGKSSRCSDCRYDAVSLKAEDFIGKKFSMLTVLEKKNSENHGSHWLCVCDCGNKKIVSSAHLRSKYKVKSCGCAKYNKAKKALQWGGVGEISKTHFISIRAGAIKRNHEFAIELNYIWDLFLKQNRKCALSKLPLTFAPSQRESNLCTASLDRIDSFKGYIEGNVQWVHKDVNIMKGSLSQERFLQLCQLVIGG